jgi:hypothetical protein
MCLTDFDDDANFLFPSSQANLNDAEIENASGEALFEGFAVKELIAVT